MSEQKRNDKEKTGEIQEKNNSTDPGQSGGKNETYRRKGFQQQPLKFPKPVVVVSKCLGFDACRYNGLTIFDAFVEKLKSCVIYVPVCPEAAIGMGIPREPVRIVDCKGKRMLYQPATGVEYTSKMEDFSKAFINRQNEITGFLLKSRSPSCGIGDVKIYNSVEKSAGSKRGSGIFGHMVQDAFPHCAIEDEGRLKNFAIREHFLTRLFVMKAFHDSRKNEKIGTLIEFHTKNKLLLMGYHQTNMRKMGSLLANHKKKNIREIAFFYEDYLGRSFRNPPKYNSIVNVIQHAFGGLSEHLTPGERQYFLNLLEEYRDERIPLSVLLHLLEAYAIRFNNSYLLDQSFLHPFPPEIVTVTDSGKGRT